MSTLQMEPMTGGEMARKAAGINFEIAVVHGKGDCRVGFVWHDTFIHNPFVDPQYGAFDVDPVDQYGGAYLESIFVTDPSNALELARQQLRTATKNDLARYCAEHDLGAPDIIEAVSGTTAPQSGDFLDSLTDEHVAEVWRHVDNLPRI